MFKGLVKIVLKKLITVKHAHLQTHHILVVYVKINMILHLIRLFVYNHAH